MASLTRFGPEAWPRAALVLIVALAAGLRLYNLGQGHPGLAIYSAISRNTTSSFHNWLYPSIFADGSLLADKPPVFFWVQGAVIGLLGPSTVALRLPAALAAIASVLLLYLIVRRCHGVTAALAAALLLAVMPLDVNFSRGVFLEPVATLAMLASTYFVVRAIQDEREEYYYVAAAVLGAAFMIKLWQGLLPAPAFAVLALTHRWLTWPGFLKVALISGAAFLVSAFWWPALVWVTSSAYAGVMHADNVWDMIFGWNLSERFGGLEYGARHRRDFLWFVTGPMSPVLGISLMPAALIGIASLTGDLWRRTTTIGLLWLVWLAVGMVGFGGASVKLASYWGSVMPAIAALSGIGFAALLGRRRGPGKLWWLSAAGFLYCADTFWIVRGAGQHFTSAAYLSLALAVLSALWAMAPGSRPFFRGRVAVTVLAVAASGVVLLNATVAFHNILKPRDDTLGRIGFDQVPMPTGPSVPVSRFSLPRLQGALITSIVRTEPEDLDAALAFVRRHRGEARYLLAADTYNTSARVSFLTGEPVLPLYSEYSRTRLTEITKLKQLTQAGEVRFVLTSDLMQHLDFELYAWLRANTEEVSLEAGLPLWDEMRLLEFTRR